MTRLGSGLRAFLLLAAVTLVAIGVGIGVLAGQPSAPQPRLTSALLPARYSFSAIVKAGSTLELTGLDAPSANTNPPVNAKCVSARVDELTLRLSDISVVTCRREMGESSPFWVVESADYTNHATARIAHQDQRTGGIVLGPVVMTWSDASDTHLQAIVGDGSLWLFDAATRKGSEVLRVSERSGKVENTIPIPGGLYRPILATDADGLWMGVATNGDYAQGLPGSPIYHVAVGSNVAKIVFIGGHATFWMLASGHTLWDDIATVSTPGGLLTQALWRFDGRQARRVFHARTDLPFGISVIGDEADGLWTVASQLPPGAGPNADTDTTCTGKSVLIRIDPNTGRQRALTTLPPGSAGNGYDCEAYDLVGDQGVIAAGDLYLLDDAAASAGGFGAYTKLLRVRL